MSANTPAELVTEAAEVKALSDLRLTDGHAHPSPSTPTNGHTSSPPGLSKRGSEGAKTLKGSFQDFFNILKNPYDEELNPDGNIIMGLADNGLMRKELLQYFTERRHKMLPNEMTYADRFFATTRLLKSVCRLFNETPDGLPNAPSAILDTMDNGSRLLTPLLPEHIVAGCGATGILDSLSWTFCDAGDGILLSTPYYNSFDADLTSRSKAQILAVETPDPAELSKDGRGLRCFESDTAKLYEERIQKALDEGITPRVLLVCNPHNPTGAIYPRETIVELAKVAAKHKLHLVADEIYARSCYSTKRIPDPLPFTSVLKMDLETEAGLPKSSLHVVTSASKDFGINGFRLGLFLSQHNSEAILGMTSLSFFSQASTPSAVLFGSLLDDEAFLSWYLIENRRRLGIANDYATSFAEHHSIPYVPSTAGHFILFDLRRFISSDEELKMLAPREAEQRLYDRIVSHKLHIAPGAIYHHPVPGWFRITFSLPVRSVAEGFKRLEKALGLEGDSFVRKVEVADMESGAAPAPAPQSIKKGVLLA